MNTEKKSLPLHWKYTIACYLTFWFMVLFICGGASMLLHASPLTMRILSNLCAWSPTIVLLCMFKRLRPGESLSGFFRNAFSGRLSLPLVLLLMVIISGGSLLSVYVLSLAEGKAFVSYFSMGGYSLAASFLLSLLSGPTGEEAGWRGYLRVELGKRYPFLKATIIQGLIWAFWHTVLWFVDSDFTGLALIPYALANVVVMTSLACVMNVVLEKRNNLVYSVAIHFAFNFVYCFLRADIWFYVVLSAVYLLIAAGFLACRKRQSLFWQI